MSLAVGLVYAEKHPKQTKMDTRKNLQKHIETDKNTHRRTQIRTHTSMDNNPFWDRKAVRYLQQPVLNHHAF